MSGKEKEQVNGALQAPPRSGMSFHVTKGIILDEMSTVIPSTTKQVKHLKSMRQKYVDKPESE